MTSFCQLWAGPRVEFFLIFTLHIYSKSFKTKISWNSSCTTQTKVHITCYYTHAAILKCALILLQSAHRACTASHTHNKMTNYIHTHTHQFTQARKKTLSAQAWFLFYLRLFGYNPWLSLFYDFCIDIVFRPYKVQPGKIKKTNTHYSPSHQSGEMNEPPRVPPRPNRTRLLNL